MGVAFLYGYSVKVRSGRASLCCGPLHPSLSTLTAPSLQAAGGYGSKGGPFASSEKLRMQKNRRGLYESN